MNETGLLAHLRDYFNVPPENLATETLAYILNSSKQARNAFNGFLQPAQPNLPTLLEFDTQGNDSVDGGIPDLVGISEGGAKPFLAEVKFDAGLTRHQPVTYLQRLIESHLQGLLLFIVPDRRFQAVWSEVRRRCSDAGYRLGEDFRHSTAMVTAQYNDAIKVGIASWQGVLQELENALQKVPGSPAYWDLRQLRDMCDRQDRQAFQPFDSQDLASRRGQRILDLMGLQEDVVEDLVAHHLARRGRSSVSWFWAGTYIYIEDWEWYFGVSWEDWAAQRPTPMWMVLPDSRARAYTPLADALTPLRAFDPSRLLFNDRRPLVPIYLPEGVDRDQVRGAMTSQIQEVADLLTNCPPPDPEQDAP